MQCSRTGFFLLFFLLFIFPIAGYKFIWILRSASTTGTMCFMGKSLNGQMASNYPVIRFSSNGLDTIFFNGPDEWFLQPGVRVPVRFLKNHPADARVNSFAGIWTDTLIYCSIPLIFISIVFLHPDIVPRQHRVIISRKPFLQFIPMLRPTHTGTSEE